MSSLRLDQFCVGYGKKIVISDISFEVSAGEILTLIGPNGSGKSTILKSITRQLDGLGGCVFLHGKDMVQMSAGEIARNLSMVMTERPDPELMTCQDVVATGRYPYTGYMGILRKEDWCKVEDAMELLDARELAQKSFSQISDGQRQRIMLARALCQDTKILVLDEPTSFLDMKYKREILTQIRKIAKEKQMAVIMSLHEIDLAVKISDRIVCVDGERIVRIGTPEEILEGDNIPGLYQIPRHAFDGLTGMMQMPSQKGEPRVMVIGGGGTAISTYYRLQREGIPFAAGILQANDVEYGIAKCIAEEVFFAKAFCEPEAEQMTKAKERIQACEAYCCTLQEFGPYNQYNRELVEYAKGLGKPEWQK